MLSLGNKLSLTTQPIYKFVNEHSVDFDGVDDCIVTDGADTVLQNTTYSFWCKTSESGSNTVFGHGGLTKGSFSLNYLSNKPLLGFSSNTYVYWQDVTAQDDGEWHHWVVYADATTIGNCKLYIDGVLQTQTNAANNTGYDAYTESLTIGGSQVSGGSYFNGKIDEFAVYDRELTQAEITRMFNTYYSPNRIQNGNFSQIGNEEVTNGDFSQIGSEQVNYPSDVSSITDPWIYDSSINKYKYIDSGSGTGRLNFGTPFAVVVGEIYKVEIDITISSGNANMQLASGNSQTKIFSYRDFVNGLNTFYTTVTGVNGNIARIFVSASNTDNDFTLNSVSVKQVGQGFTFGDGWGMADGLATCDGTQSSNSTLETTVGISGITNKQVKFSFDITNYQAGTLSATLQGTGGNEFAGLNSNGTYTAYISSADNTPKIIFTGDSSFVGSIDNISVKEVGQHWTFGTGWSMGDGVATCDGSQTSNSNLIQNTGVPTVGKTFKMSYKVSNYSQGAAYISMGGYNYAGSNISSDGQFTQEITVTNASSNTSFYITANSDFVATIDNIVVEELKHDATNLMLNAGAYQSANPLITSTKSMDFDGSDDYLNISDPTTTDLDFTDGIISCSAWIYLTSNSYGTVLNKGGGYYWYVGTAPTGITQRVFLGNSGGKNSSTALTINKWHHIAFTSDNSNIKFYIDGKLDNTVSASYTIAANTDDLRLGRSSSGEYLEGNLTEVGMYNRTLTDLEVASLYNQGMPTNLLVNRNNYQSGNPTVFNTKQVDFDGSDDRLEAKSTLGSFTGSVSFWAKRADISGFQYLIDFRKTSGTGYVYLENNTHSIFVSSGTVYVDGVAGTTISEDNWHHIVVTGITLNITECIIFGARYTYAQFFIGEMSQVGLWNSTLTANEVSSLYNHGLPIDLTTDQAAYESSSNLVGYWRMGSGTLDTYPLIADQTNATLSAEYVKNGDFSQIGSEEIVNGSFTGVANGTDVATLANWNNYNSPTSKNVVDNKLVIVTTGANQGAYYDLGSLTGTYRLSVDITGDVGAGGIYISSATSENVTTSVGTLEHYFEASGNTIIFFRAAANNTGTTSYTNISVKEVLQDWSFTGAASGYQTYTGSGIKMYSGSVSDNQNALSTSGTLNLSGTLGKVYKMDITASDFVNGSNGYIRLNSVYDASNIISFVEGTQTVYFTAYQDFTFIRFFAGSANSFITVNSISIKEVGGNPAIMTNQTSSDIEVGSPYANEVENGTFETEVTTAQWLNFGSPTTAARSTTYAYEGTHSYHIVGDSQNDGTQATAGQFSWALNDVVRVTAYVYPITASNNFILSGVSNSDKSITGSHTVVTNQWNKIEYDATITSASNNYITFLISGTAGEFYLDSVTAVKVNTGLQGYWKMGDGTNDEYPVIFDQTNPTNSAELVTNGDFATG